jgi:hypothetical protein
MRRASASTCFQFTPISYHFRLFFPSTGRPYVSSGNAEAQAREQAHRLPRLLGMPRLDGTKSRHAERWWRNLRRRGKPNPLANMKKMTLLDLTEPWRIWVPWTMSGTAAHGLAVDGRTVLGPWITFSSAETFERALRYVGMTDQQLEEHRHGMSRAGTDAPRQASSLAIARTCSRSTGRS